MHKKSLCLCAAILLAAAPVFSEQDFALCLAPLALLPMGEAAEYFVPGFGVEAAAEWAPLSFNGIKGLLGLRLGGGYSGITVETGTAFSFYEWKLGPVFRWRPLDRLSLWAEGNAGAFQYQYDWNGDTDTQFRFGGSLGADIHLSPAIALSVSGAYTRYNLYHDASIDTIGINVGVRFSLSELFKKDSAIQGEVTEQSPVFPVSYAWYEKNPVAMLRVTNHEKTAITRVNFSLYQEQFMSQSASFAEIPRLEAGETIELPVTALFNEAMLDLTENMSANAQVLINYRALGAGKETSLPMVLPVFHRNAMSWDDDRRAASFVSAHDPAAQIFARYVETVVQTRKRPALPLSVQYALGVFEALNIYGINYVIDPASSYIELSESAGSLDSLNYPYQTLFYRGGDCDDLSILFCSLLEALGVDTAFITIPGHIYMAFDTGKAESNLQFGGEWKVDEGLIEHDGRLWMPVEITVTNRGFLRAWRIGAREWRDAGDEARFYPMKDSWAIYPPVSVPDATRRAPALPQEDVFIAALENSLNTVGEFVIRDRVQEMERAVSRSGGAQQRLLYNEMGILYSRYGILTKAAAAFGKAADNDAVINIGHLAFIEGRYQDAIRRYQQIVLNQNEDAQSWLGIARALYDSGDFPRAAAAYGDVVRVNPALAGLYPYLGSYRDWQGRPRSYADRLGSTVWANSGAMQELERLAAERTASERLAAERLAADKLALELLAKDSLSMERLAEAVEAASSVVNVPIPEIDPENKSPAFYVVKHRDTLANIARLSFVYADGTQWPVLYEANKSTLPDPDNPNLIVPGMVLRLPSISGEQRSGAR
ncbi:MAG: LysM peptidoglycan-binding domain-containing protein [Treponema sp.]|jgi:tetratricopeptide (TPR) repeat protein|nr:LysM peptidoglycan-binding domain-containing protein [Treponema sp.]